MTCVMFALVAKRVVKEEIHLIRIAVSVYSILNTLYVQFFKKILFQSLNDIVDSFFERLQFIKWSLCVEIFSMSAVLSYISFVDIWFFFDDLSKVSSNCID